MLDIDAYLRRIGLDPADEPTWQAVHRAHATTIPFENLDSHGGFPISLEQADLGASGSSQCWRASAWTVLPVRRGRPAIWSCG